MLCVDATDFEFEKPRYEFETYDFFRFGLLFFSRVTKGYDETIMKVPSCAVQRRESLLRPISTVETIGTVVISLLV